MWLEWRELEREEVGGGERESEGEVREGKESRTGGHNNTILPHSLLPDIHHLHHGSYPPPPSPPLPEIWRTRPLPTPTSPTTPCLSLSSSSYLPFRQTR
ncbi:hypothetical protein E2C01_046775 [Portunus trituberculatus]|uniref:Uncharacterized protein n=1 Tax=Portunus trituberculatus TaxID=210409 RepID=A0A5B7G5Z4_PORTR|nr:hypothetical protein [Portunus trituberculatus]